MKELKENLGVGWQKGPLFPGEVCGGICKFMFNSVFKGVFLKRVSKTANYSILLWGIGIGIGNRKFIGKPKI